MSIVEDIYTITSLKKDEPALIDPKSRILTFGELHSRTDLLAGLLMQDEFRNVKNCLVYVPLSGELYILLAALLKTEKTIIFIDPDAGREYVSACLSLITPDMIIYEGKARFLLLKHRVLRTIPKRFKLSRLLKKAQIHNHPHTARPRFDEDRVALITFTSGSLHNPRGFERTNKFLVAQHSVFVREITSAMKKSRNLTWFPFYVLANLAAGITSVLAPLIPPHPKAVYFRRLGRFMEKQDVSSITVSPGPILDFILHCQFENKQFSQIKRIVMGGGPLSPYLIDHIEKIFPHAEIEFFYGSTEALPIAKISLADVRKQRHASETGKGIPLGTPIPEIRVEIADPESVSHQGFSSRLRGEVGEIIIRGEIVGTRYCRNIGFTSHKIVTEEGIWHRTGDYGYLDESGVLFFMGRRNNIFSSGTKVFFSTALEIMLECKFPMRKAALITPKKDTLICFLEPAPKDPIGSALTNEMAEILKKVTGITPDIRITRRLPFDRRHRTRIDYDLLIKKNGIKK